MNALADRPPERDLVVMVDHRVVRQDTAAYVDGHKGSYDRTDSATRKLRFPIYSRLITVSVVIIEAPGDARPKQPVLNGQITEV
jgi:hypothetical protein